MIRELHTALRIALLVLGSFFFLPPASAAQIQLPAFDPTGSRVFLPAPNSTTLLLPGSASGVGLFGHPRQPQAVPPTQPAAGNGWLAGLLHPHRKQSTAPPAQPAFVHPQDPAPCSSCGHRGCNGLGCRQSGPKQHVIPKPALPNSHGKLGEIIMTPHRIVAPVGAEVVVLAGICGGDGYFVKNQPLEWMLSNDSVGQIIEVGGMEHEIFNKTVAPTSRKFDGQYAHGRTGLKAKLLTRGSPSPGDDIDVLEGQAYLSLHSASPGTTWLTAVAPDAQAWDKRRATTVIHWIDGLWSIPAPIVATSGTVQPVTTTVSRVADGSGLAGWKVRYTIVGGTPAEFAPTGSQSADLETGSDGQATVQLRQKAGRIEPGTTQIRVDVIRPPVAGEAELVVESGLTGVTWSAPALTLRAIGPRAAAINEAYNYRVEISNPGDQVARDVVVSTEDLGDAVQFISSEPKPSVYGKRYEWRLGDLPPGTMPVPVNIQLRSDQRGIKRACFRVASQSDQLQTEACAETEVAAPCLGVRLNGPTTARVGDEFSFEIEIVNQCNDALENVRVSVQYDPGLSALQLGNPIEASVGSLKFGEKKSLPLTFRAVSDGIQCFALNVVADGGHTATGRRCVEVANVITGQVSVQISGPQIVQQGQTLITTARVTNSGNVPLDNLVLNNRTSRSLRPLQASSAFRNQMIGEELAVFVGSLNPGQSVDVQVQYETDGPDPNAFTQFTASTPSGAQSQQQSYPVRIEPEGAVPPAATGSGQPLLPGNPGQGGVAIPPDPRGGLQIAVETLDPEIIADQRTQGRIRFTVTNARTTPEQNVRITLLVPPGLRLNAFDNSQGQLQIVSSSADQTRHALETRAEMRPGEQLTFVAGVIAAAPGQAIFEVQATSDNTLGSVTGQSAIRVLPTQ